MTGYYASQELANANQALMNGENALYNGGNLRQALTQVSRSIAELKACKTPSDDPLMQDLAALAVKINNRL